MAQQTLNTKISLRNDSSANWEANKSKVLLKGEVGIEFLASGKAKMKVGDGTTTWENLEYFGNAVTTGTTTGAPTTSTPGQLGDLYVDTTTDKVYIYTGEDGAPWQQVVTPGDLSDLGAGDMLKAEYATNGISGTVDKAQKVLDSTTGRNNAVIVINDEATGADATTNNAIWTANKVKSVVDGLDTATEEALNKKVDAVTGKGLSTNDYTTEEKNKLAALLPVDDATVAETNVWSAKKINDTISSNKETSDKAIEDLQKAVDKKVDAVAGKGLSTNDYTTAEQTKLAGIAEGAEVNVQADWNITDTSSDAYIANKPAALPADGGNADTVGNKTVDDSKDTDAYLWTASKTKAYADGLLAANDAMVFKGIVDGTNALPANGYRVGDTYKVGAAGTYAGQACEIGDMIICVKSYLASAADSDWQVIQTNIDGAVTSAETASTEGTIAVFSGTSGKVIKQGTKKISDLEYTLPASTASALGGGKAVATEATDTVAGRKVQITTDGTYVLDSSVLLSSDTFVFNGGSASN